VGPVGFRISVGMVSLDLSRVPPTFSGTPFSPSKMMLSQKKSAQAGLRGHSRFARYLPRSSSQTQVSNISNFGRYVAISGTWTLNAINSSKGVSAHVAGPIEKFSVGNVSDAPIICASRHRRNLLATDHTVSGIITARNGSDLAGIRTFKATDTARVEEV
jgi:hypothetical protein